LLQQGMQQQGMQQMMQQPPAMHMQQMNAPYGGAGGQQQQQQQQAHNNGYQAHQAHQAHPGQSAAAAMALRSLAASAPAEVAGGFHQVLDALNSTKEAIQAGRSWFMSCEPHAPALAAIMAERAVAMGVQHGALAVERQLQVRFLRRRDPLLALGKVAHTTPTLCHVTVPLYGSSLPPEGERPTPVVEGFSEFGIS
jgi:hypothetical protein